MPFIDQTSRHNRLLRQLRPDNLTRLAPHSEPVALLRGAVSNKLSQPFDHATSPEGGVVTVLSVSPQGRTAESGPVGGNGFRPMSLALNVGRSPQRCIVQVSGAAHRTAASALREALAASPLLHRLLPHHARILAVQVSLSALSDAVYSIDERLARWLLMCHDRVTGYELTLTHDFLSTMLGMRRPSVTPALHVLEGHRFVRTSHGLITITDRPGLEAFAGNVYGLYEAEYARLLGPVH